MSFKFKKLEIPEIILIEPSVFADSRGFFFETYKYPDFEQSGIKDSFVQDNHAISVKNALRGLHYQKSPAAQAKLVRCIKGEILDVAVDIRKSSKTFKKWVKALLSEQNKHMLYIPEGFAHGYLTLSEYSEILYKASREYSGEHEAGIIWNDPDLNIDWQIKAPILSDRDLNLLFLKDAQLS
ncbi:MAG: dTDP-4-dehydrorhamnose 3,5-epimerase [Elusimicrobia bacterium]|nr:dTDP-4-dehydrorhamnose 3,5-epimerase [Elusimicrobiota bacterium]